jgi:hypothetical protein
MGSKTLAYGIQGIREESSKLGDPNIALKGSDIPIQGLSFKYWKEKNRSSKDVTRAPVARQTYMLTMNCTRPQLNGYFLALIHGEPGIEGLRK